MNKIKAFFRDESGMETLEYVLIAGLIALVVVVVFGAESGWDTTLQRKLLDASQGTGGGGTTP